MTIDSSTFRDRRQLLHGTYFSSPVSSFDAHPKKVFAAWKAERTKRSAHTMADESFEKEIESVQEKLASLTIQIEAFEIVSQAVIKSDHNSILMELHQSVDSVERTILFLETSKKKSAGLIEAPSRVPGAWHDDEAADGSVSGHVSDMHRNFSSLRRSARSALERVEGIKEECDDSDVLLDAIRTELESLTTRVKRSLKTAKSMLIIKEKEIQELKKTLKNEEEQISAMESKVEDKKDDRNVMRVVSVLSESTLLPCSNRSLVQRHCLDGGYRVPACLGCCSYLGNRRRVSKPTF